jgi:[acyl-carrier-protein] S-malonyltransferase
MFAALFPGQGSQHVGMGRFLEEFSPLARQTFEEASDTLGIDMRRLCFEGPEDQLVLTENTQPSLLTVSVATYRVLENQGFMDNIKGAAGHSVGEYAALVNARVLPFAKALQLVKLRGQLMQQTVPVGEGGMLAVMGLEPDDVEKLCQWAEQASGLGPIEPANYNSPGQVVISGRSSGLQWLQKNIDLEKAGLSGATKVRLIPLKVSAPFHCSMMNRAQEELGHAIREVEFHAPQYPIAQNYTGQMETEPHKLQDNLIRQVSGAVRWTQCMDALHKNHVNTALELGPGKVLTGLLKKMDLPNWSGYNFNSNEDLTHFAQQMGS